MSRTTPHYIIPPDKVKTRIRQSVIKDYACHAYLLPGEVIPERFKLIQECPHNSTSNTIGMLSRVEDVDLIPYLLNRIGEIENVMSSRWGARGLPGPTCNCEGGYLYSALTGEPVDYTSIKTLKLPKHMVFWLCPCED